MHLFLESLKLCWKIQPNCGLDCMTFSKTLRWRDIWLGGFLLFILVIFWWQPTLQLLTDIPPSLLFVMLHSRGFNRDQQTMYFAYTFWRFFHPSLGSFNTVKNWKYYSWKYMFWRYKRVVLIMCKGLNWWFFVRSLPFIHSEAILQGILKDGTEVAVKTLSAESKQGVREFLTEISTISNVRHPNLVELIGCCAQGTNRALVYEYLENNSLDRALLGNWPTYEILKGC